MEKIKLLFLISLVTILVSNSEGVAMAEGHDYRAEIKEKFSHLDLSKGVSKEEAIIIAQNYLIDRGFDKKYMITRSTVEDFEFGDWNEWRVTFKARYGESIKQANIFGFLGIFKWWISVNVDKKTGEVKSVGGPDL